MFIIIGSLLILLTKIKKNIFCKDMKKKNLKKTWFLKIFLLGWYLIIFLENKVNCTFYKQLIRKPLHIFKISIINLIVR